MFISYAQRLEDYHLDLVLGDIPNGTYVDVGGGHPVADNVTLHFYLKGWRGLVVEPQAHLARLYAGVRPRDAVAETLVGRSEGQIAFYEVAGMHGFSTSVQANALQAQGMGATVTPVSRPLTTLAALCPRHGIGAIDLLKIDVEGAEADVIAGHDWRGLRPKIVVVEAVAPGTMAPAWDTWEPMLIEAGYQMAFFDDLNRFYVAREAAQLSARFPERPAAWNAVVHPYDYGRALEQPSHPDRALALALANGLMALAPTLEPALLARLIDAGGGLPGHADVATALGTDALRVALGRIAAHYDGGLLVE
jgi:FkbM family methyltransferase